MDATMLKRFQEDSVEQYVNYFSRINKTKLFYFRIVPKLLNSILRNKGVSYTLLIIYQLQEAALVIKADTNLDSTTQSYTNMIVNALDYVLLKSDNGYFNNDIATETLFYFSLIYNLTLIILLGGACLVYHHYQYRSHQIRDLCRFYSAVYKVYNYIFFIPFLVVGIQIISNSDFSNIRFLGFLNSIITVFLGLIFNYQDFDYSYVVKDYLSRRESKFDLIRQLLLSLLVIFNAFLGQDLIGVVLFIYSLFKIFIYHQEQLYTYEEISLLNQTLNFIFASYSGIMVFYFVISSDNIFLLMLMAVPLCYKLASFIQKKYYQQIFDYCIGKTDLSHLPLTQLDIYVRQLNKNLNFFFEDYIEKGQALIFENIFINHSLTCQINSYKCFCFEFKRDENAAFNLEEYIGQEYRRKYVVFYIVDLFEKYIDNLIKKRNQQSSAMFYYISFLFEVMNISTKSFSEIYSYQSKLIKLGSSVHDMYYTQILLTRTNRQFEQFFKNAIIQNQRLYMMSMIVFDEQFDLYKKRFHLYLQKIGEFFDYLCSNFLDLKELEAKSRVLYDQNSLLLFQMQTLYDLNPENRELNFFSTIYNSVLDFENRKVSDFVKKSQRLPGKNLLPSEKHIKVFVKNSCVVYASLDTIGGKIMKVSKSFSEVYDIDNKIIIGKTINSLIPKGLYGAHDDFMKNFRNKGTMNVIKIGERLVFGLNGKGFIVPMMIRLKLENMFGEFGVCSHLTKVNHEKDYLFFSNEGNILDISENLFTTVFSSMISINDLRLLNMNHIIPLIFGIQKLEQFNETFYSILVVKKHRDKKIKNMYTAVESLKMIETIVNAIKPTDTIYNITFKMCLIPTSLGVSFKFVEITSFQKEMVRRNKQNSISQLKECINIFIDFEKQDVVDHQLLSTKLKFDQNGQTAHHLDSEPEIGESDMSYLQSTYVQSTLRQGTIMTDSKQMVVQNNQYVQNHHSINTISISNNLNSKLTSGGERIDIDKILSPIQKQTTFIVPAGEFTDRQELNGYYQSTATELQTRRETAGQGEFRPENQDYDQNSLIQKYQSDLASPLRNQFEITSLIQQEAYNNLSPKDSQRILVTPRSHFEDYSTKAIKFADQFEPSKFKQEDQENLTQLPPLSPHPLLINLQGLAPEQTDGFVKDQSNTYKAIMQNQLNVQQKLQRVKQHEKTVTTSQATLKNYNDSMKQLQSKGLIEGPISKKNQQYKKKILKRDDESKSSNISSNSIVESDGEVKNEDHNDIQSLRSSNFSIREQKKKIIIKKIYSTQDTDGLKFFIFAGVLSFLVILIITIFQQEQRSSTFNNYNQNFNTLDLFNSALYDILRSLSSGSYIFFTQFDTYIFQNDTREAQFNQTMTDYQVILSDLKTRYLNILDLDNSLSYQQRLFEKADIELLKQNGDGYTIFNLPILYIFAITIVLVFGMNSSIDDTTDFFEMWANYLNIKENISNLQLDVQAYAQQQFSYISELMYTNLFTILGVSLFISLTLIPLSIIIKKQKEKILMLFGSFSPEKMQKYVDLIEYCLFNIDMAESSIHNIRNMNKAIHQINKEIESAGDKQTQDGTSNGDQNALQKQRKNALSIPHNINNPNSNTNSINMRSLNKSKNIQMYNTYIKRVPQKRNRSIASFTSLPKLDTFILLTTLLIVIILMIMPLVTLIQTNSFINECNVIVQQRISILNLQNFLYDQQANHYTIWMFGYLGGNNDSVNSQIKLNYNELTTVLMPQINTYMSNLQELMSQTSSFNYNPSLYNNFFIGILNDNICNLATTNSQYFNSNIASMNCADLSEGVLQQGLIISYKQLFSTLQTLIYYYGSDITQMRSLYPFLYQEQQTTNFISDLNDFIRYLSYITEGLDNFLVYYQQQYFNYLQSCQNIIFYISLVMIVLIFSIMWWILYQRLREDLTKSKNLLTLFHINLIMENNLFLQYLKQNKFGTSN